MPWTTLFRTPRMSAESGVWLEGFSKRDAQAALIVLPWALIVGSLVFHVTLYAFEVRFPRMLQGLQDIEAVAHLTVTAVCVLYLPVALIYERPCCSCRRRGPRRSMEGWLALLPLLVCAASSLAYAQGRHSRLDAGGQAQGGSQTKGVVIIHGSLLFRAAASAEFLMQLVWLWAADRLRYEGQPTPRCKCWFYCILPLLWCFTFCGPWEEKETPHKFDHALVLFGYSARFCLFVYCVAHVCRNRAHQCCCGCLQDWRVLEEPCTPGRQRLRYLTYYLLTRPPFLLLVNLPLGYPLAICAPFASAVRCGFAFLLAVVLRPAPREAIGEHPLEEDTRGRFDVALAARLWEYANEAYVGKPAPQRVLLKDCTYEELNGEYEREGCDSAGFSVYSRVLTAGLHHPVEEAVDASGEPSAAAIVEAGAQVFLRRTPADEWELSPSTTVQAGVRWAYVRSTAISPDQADGLWFEVVAGAPLAAPRSNTELRLLAADGAAQRRFERHGSCPETDVHWLLVEEEGPMAAPSKLGRPQDMPVASIDGSELSIVVAFRGTNSWQNLVTDARISMQNLPRPGAAEERASQAVAEATADLEAFEEAEGGAPRSWWRPRWPRWVRARRSLQPLSSSAVPFDLELQVGEQLRRGRSSESLAAEPSSSSADVPGRPGRQLPPGAEPLAAAADGGPPSAADPPSCCFRLACWVCRTLGRCCVLLLLPFLPPSDFEEDDEEFSESTLSRVRVHMGFSQAYASVCNEVKSLLRDRLDASAAEGRSVRVYVTGHSLGGAIASLFALDLANAGRRSEESPFAEEAAQTSAPVVYTFGSPRLGNAAFRSIYNALVPYTFRIVASRDLVPTLPPSITYRQLGREVWLDDAGEVTFVMSWAMRHILPARDSIRCHPMSSYYGLLAMAFRRKWGYDFASKYSARDVQP